MKHTRRARSLDNLMRCVWGLLLVGCTSISTPTKPAAGVTDTVQEPASVADTGSVDHGDASLDPVSTGPAAGAGNGAGIGGQSSTAMPVAGTSGAYAPVMAGTPGVGQNAGGMAGGGMAGGPVTDPGCPQGQLLCNGTCVPDDPRNCGACNHDCTALPRVIGNVSCVNGVCQFDGAACAKGWLHCGQDPELGCETDATQPTSCGGCGVQCTASEPMCSNGSCVSGCQPAAPTLCGQTCVDLQSDALHCGSCEKACSTNIARAQPTCARGSCGFECMNGLSACTNACVDTSRDAQNCGACGQRCTGGKQCTAGRCDCPAGTHDCSGSCVRDDAVTSCGSSCQACRSGVSRATDVCESGRCSYRCPFGTSDCGRACVDQLSDNRNCGACGKICTGGKTCSVGVCVCASGQHDCSGSCVSNNLTSSCGSSCTPCPEPAGATASCDGKTCSSRCDSGVSCFGACADTKTDPRNCGGCGRRSPNWSWRRRFSARRPSILRKRWVDDSPLPVHL